MSLLDPQNAFDTVNHNILLMKLKAMRLTDSAIRWCSSHLNDRSKLVENSGVLSSSASISCGVPQASIQRPGLSLNFVNNMSSVVTNK